MKVTHALNIFGSQLHSQRPGILPHTLVLLISLCRSHLFTQSLAQACLVFFLSVSSDLLANQSQNLIAKMYIHTCKRTQRLGVTAVYTESC